METELVGTELVAELEARVEIRQLEELEVFDSLRLSVVVAAEVLADVLAGVLAEVAAEILAEILVGVLAEVLAEILAAEVLVELASGTELV